MILAGSENSQQESKIQNLRSENVRLTTQLQQAQEMIQQKNILIDKYEKKWELLNEEARKRSSFDLLENYSCCNFLKATNNRLMQWKNIVI